MGKLHRTGGGAAFAGLRGVAAGSEFWQGGLDRRGGIGILCVNGCLAAAGSVHGGLRARLVAMGLDVVPCCDM